jgi:hypothetical protein
VVDGIYIFGTVDAGYSTDGVREQELDVKFLLGQPMSTGDTEKWRCMSE